jgi:hypothetical protein
MPSCLCYIHQTYAPSSRLPLGNTTTNKRHPIPKTWYNNDSRKQKSRILHTLTHPSYCFPSKLSTLFFKSRFITSKPGPAFFVLSEKLIAVRSPEKSSRLINVVCPGVTLLGRNSKKCFPTSTPFQPPSQTKRSGEFS